jgi:hypothetical protein
VLIAARLLRPQTLILPVPLWSPCCPHAYRSVVGSSHYRRAGAGHAVAIKPPGSTGSRHCASGEMTYSDSLRISRARSSAVATLWAVQRPARGAEMPLAFSISAISLAGPRPHAWVVSAKVSVTQSRFLSPARISNAEARSTFQRRGGSALFCTPAHRRRRFDTSPVGRIVRFRLSVFSLLQTAPGCRWH